jgi:hypothetical protein
MKPNINSVEVHPQMRDNGHPVDGVLVGAGSPRPLLFTIKDLKTPNKMNEDKVCLLE